MKLFVLIKDDDSYALNRDGQIRAFDNIESAQRSIKHLPTAEGRRGKDGKWQYFEVTYRIVEFTGQECHQ